MQNKKFFFSKSIMCASLLVLTGGLLFGAKKNSSKAAPIPAWVSNPAGVYSRDAYLFYVGDGSDRTKAELSAVNGLSAIFGQSIKSDFTSSQKMVQAKADGKVASNSVTGFSQDVMRSVDSGDLVGVEIKDFYFDGTTWYAIAVLDKAKASDIYSEMIVKNAKAIKSLLENAAADKNSLESYSAYDFAADISFENEKHYKKLSVINPDAAASLKVDIPSLNEINARKVEVAKNIPISVLVSGDTNGKIAAAFTEAIASLGFRTSLRANVRYVLTCTLNFEKSATSDGKTQRCRYSLDSFILDSKTNHQFAPFTASGRESHLSYPEAENRAVKSLEKKIKSDFTKSFSDYLKNFTGE